MIDGPKILSFVAACVTLGFAVGIYHMVTASHAPPAHVQAMAANGTVHQLDASDGGDDSGPPPVGLSVRTSAPDDGSGTARVQQVWTPPPGPKDPWK